MVDRAANKRRFLVIKRDASATVDVQPGDLEVVTAADGTLTAVPAQPTAPAQPPPAAAAATPPAATPPPAATDAVAAAAAPPGATVALTDSARAGLTEVLQTVRARVDSALALVKSATRATAETDNNVDALVDLTLNSRDDLEDVTYAVLGLDDAEVQKSDKPWVPETIPARLELRRARRVVAKADVERGCHVLVEKVGARMAKERLRRFKQAMSLLSEIVGELTPEQIAEHQQRAGSKAAASAPAAAVAKSEAALAPQTVAMLETIARSVQALTVVVGQQTQAIAKARTGDGTSTGSNAIPVEGGGGAREDVELWPQDMNDPRSRRGDADYFG